jgi:hypothetical protein
MARRKKPQVTAPTFPTAADRATFLALSALLTGFSETDLEGTGVVDTALNSTVLRVGKQIAGEMLAGARAALQQPDPTAAVQSGIWASPKYGPVVQNLVYLWYVGAWRPMPRQWQEQYLWEQPERDLSLSNEWLSPPQPYEQALVWRAIYAHPPGVKPTGFASWSEPPEEVRTKLVSIAAAGGSK